MDEKNLFDMLDKMLENGEDEVQVNRIRAALEEGDYETAIERINRIIKKGEEDKKKVEDDIELIHDGNREEKKSKENTKSIINFVEEKEEEPVIVYPEDLLNNSLEESYIGMLLNDAKSISMYYILFEDCYFADNRLLNVYKSILFTEGQAFAPEIAKRGYNFAKDTKEMNEMKEDLKDKYSTKRYDFEKLYVELRKIFILRKNYLGMPIKDIQDRIVEIVHYNLYDKMTIEEVEAAIEQVTVTQKFKSSILSKGVSSFLMRGENDLTTG